MTDNYQITAKNAWLHFKKICIHKYWVAYYCFKCGLYWQGITHDLSKFSFVEFWESVKFYKGTSSPIPVAKQEQGYSTAWQHHKGRNPHHYEYWTDNYDKGTTTIKMPLKYAIELICDYLGAARAYESANNTNLYDKEFKWWINKVSTTDIAMNDHTKKFVGTVFARLAATPDRPWETLNKKALTTIYNIIP